MRVWSVPARAVLSVAALALAAGTLAFLAALFLHVAPANSVSRAYAAEVDAVVYPEFEQNWKLFAPDPLQQNITLDARVQTIAEDGRISTRDWFGLTARDFAAVRHNPAPSHVDQNLLRRAFDFYRSTHSEQDGAPAGPQGRLAEQYLKRIALQRTGPSSDGERILQIQFRVSTATVAPPPWSEEQVDTAAHTRELPWWPVDEADLRGLR
ncbi:hypothetical protein GCM10023235_40000 [Kitasatospora terrestris]|uniref:Uncharacterized protein n=1 Tax=Kitasatospora terrestris TaxID=258051 RepID=A0ABP9DVY3_9ACTN